MDGADATALLKALATIKRRWSFARAWLYDRLEGEA